MSAFRCKSLLMTLALMLLVSPTLMAQQWEINPYAGLIWPSHGRDVGQINHDGIYGVRVGYFFDPNFELEGNFGYINHFQVKGLNVKSRGVLWEVAGDYNFSTDEFPFSRHFAPFLVAGVGGITTLLRDVDSFKFSIVQPVQIVGVVQPVQIVGNGQVLTLRTIEMRDHDTFF